MTAPVTGGSALSTTPTTTDSGGSGATAELQGPKLMTVDRLRELLAPLSGHLEVFVNAVDDDGYEVFAAVKDAFQEPTCDGAEICRLFADREDDDAC